MILQTFLIKVLFMLIVIMNCVLCDKSSDEFNKPDIARVGKTRRDKMKQNTAVGTFSNVITQIQNLPNMDLGRRFRTPCKTGNKCGKVIKRLMVPKLAQLENTIMGVMKELAKMPPGSRLPDKYTKTEPIKLLLDQNYKEDVCMDKLESCLKEDKRRKRILKKLFFKKYNSIRQELIGYGGRRLWGGEGNLFYR
ncbi:uncharacterized protein LOC113396971 [Vanessa tameamea]|uniref:Uncharacterized protein LOC113396971 n=1 Tax=Vanessa tameamea TaxID=334116 RepID=A0A8B8I1I7_VANTA|nr:uncharacterized protein LOC113396971 [Vanessa tameamea]XP_047529751.1 uncharacterized protein LOC125065936 [Vanessa atalanta]